MGFQHCQWLGRTGIVGSLGIKLGSTTLNRHPYAACQLGKEERTPKVNFFTENHDVGSIKVNQINPGDLILSYQYDSRIEGCHFTAWGHSLSTQKYHGVTLFCDAAIFKVTAIHQVVITRTETAQSKLQFEQDAADLGIYINQLCTDNGIYTSK